MNNSLKDSVTSLQKSVNGLIDATKDSISNIPIDDRDYLCFTACVNNCTITLNRNGNPHQLILEYSTNKVKWEPFVLGQTYTLANAGDKIWLRNTHTNTSMSGFSSSNYYQFVFSQGVEASGNILSLLYSQFERMNNAVTPSFCFYKLFSGNTWTLKTAPKLPSYQVGTYSYNFMFDGCQGLVEPPELPATTLASGCYYGMFQGCSGLKRAPYLPATTLVGECYRDMFKNCSQIDRIRVNFSTFDGTSHTYWWVSGVASNGVFECPSTVTISRGVSNIPNNWTIVWTDKMQANWSQTNTASPDYIQNKPTLPDTNDYLCFTALQSDSTVALNKQGGPVALNIEYSTDKETWTAYTWDGTAGKTVTLTSIGDKVWFRTVSEVVLNNSDSIYYVFAMTGKIGASGNLMSLMYKDFENAYEAKAYQFYRLFDMCPIVTPPKVPATKLGEACYKYLFRQCSILESAPELPATTLAGMCYQGMFVNCASLTVAPELPATTMVYRCYNSMLAFTAITDAPYLRATTLATECYRNIFNTCLNLKRIRTNQTSWENNAWLTGSSVTGIIECPSALDCSTRDTNHVPAGWTIVRTDAPQSDWDESDSTEASFILNKPELFSGDYNDLTNKPTIPAPQVKADWDESDSSEPSFILNKPVIPQPSESVQADWDESDSSEPSFIRNKPTLFSGDYDDLTDKPDLSVYAESSSLATVATSGSYTDLIDKPTIPTPQVNSDWDESDSSEVSFILNKPTLFSGSYTDLTDKPDLSVYVEKETGKGLSSNDFTDAYETKLNGIETGAEVNVNADWDESDSTEDAFIRNKPTLFSGSYNDLTDKPTIPAPQVQTDWDESDSSEVSFILNKPELFSGDYNDLTNKPTIPASQVNSDWDESDSSEVSFILNKPVIPVVPSNLQKYVMTDDATSSSTVEVSPSGDVVKHITVASALTLSATSATGIAYAEIVLDISAGATVTAGTGITLVDIPEAGKSNICVVRWSGGTAKLYVTIVEDLPQA